MGKLTISMAIFNSYVKLPEGMFINKKPPEIWRSHLPPWQVTVAARPHTASATARPFLCQHRGQLGWYDMPHVYMLDTLW